MFSTFVGLDSAGSKTPRLYVSNTRSSIINYDISAKFDQEHFNVVQVMVSRLRCL